ncbi:hypothetical protein NX059_011549 [Plenodomus lindquistii]|nr:hypothetical protein NX059_011549 [Plenodomus lindquistii]
MANGWAPIIGLVVVVVFCLAAWILAPKGENQTYVYSRFLRSLAYMHADSILYGLRDAQRHCDRRLHVNMRFCKMTGYKNGRELAIPQRIGRSQPQDLRPKPVYLQLASSRLLQLEQRAPRSSKSTPFIMCLQTFSQHILGNTHK